VKTFSEEHARWVLLAACAAALVGVLYVERAYPHESPDHPPTLEERRAYCASLVGVLEEDGHLPKFYSAVFANVEYQCGEFTDLIAEARGAFDRLTEQAP